MTTLYLILLLLAAICFGIAAFFRLPATPRVNFQAAGLFFWVLVPLISTFKSLTG